MKITKIGIILAVFFLFATISYAENETSCFYFFYGQGCSHCAKVIPVINEIVENNGGLDVRIFEVYHNRSNLVLMEDYFEQYTVPQYQHGVPALFIGDTYLVGDTPIIENIDRLIRENKGEPCPSLEEKNAVGEAGAKSPKEELKTLSLVTVIGAAIVDSINPCAIAVLLILLGALLAAGNKKKAIKAGFAFTASIYIVYFLFGLGLFSALQITGLSFWFYKIIGILAIAIGLFNIKDFFWYGGGGFVMEIPRRWRPALKGMLGKVTTPLGAFLIGFAVCLFELPCTGGPYLVILGLLAEKTTQMGAIPILLLYNLFFVIPLIVITIAIYFGFSTVHKAGEWKERNIRLLHLIAGIIMLVLGILVVFGLV